MKSERRRVRFYFICLAAGLLLCSCGPKRTVFFSDPSFPPEANPPIKVFLAAPVDSMDLSLARDDMIGHSEGDPARALEKAKCFWDKGLTDLTRRISEDTELKSNILVDPSAYPPTSGWIGYSSDALSVPTFSLADPAILSKFQTDGFDYVVVPQDLSVLSSVGKRASTLSNQPLFSGYPLIALEELYFETPVAVIDVRKNAVVWTGVVSSARHSLAVHTSTIIEREAYDWLYDLLAVLGRNMREPSPRFQACK